MNLSNKMFGKWLLMKPFLLFFLFFLNSNNSLAQTQYNLVPNWSFEDYIICPSASNGLPPPPPWYSAGKMKSVNYFNSCNPDLGYTVPTNATGYQYARTGNGYSGLFFINGLSQNNRNYIQAKLKDSLYQGQCYYINFFVNLGNNYKYACNNIGLLFTKTAVYVDTIAHPNGVLPATPQILNYGNPIITDTMNWVKVSGVYTAQGGEQFITLGNFKSDALTSYKQIQPTGYNGAGYAIDDVSVIPLDSMQLKADAGKDTTIILSDSAFIGSLTNGIDSLQWLQNGILKIDSTRPGFWVHPLVSTCYVLTQTVNGFTSSDTVCVNVNTVPLKFIQFAAQFKPTPNPSKEGNVLLQWQTANEINVSHFNILKSNDGVNFKVIGKIKAQNNSYNNYSFTDENVSNGVNYYKIAAIDKDGKINFSETRTLNFKPQTLNGVNIYPNPAKEFVTVECKEAKELMIIDCLGRIILRKQITNNQSTTINVQQLNKGLYLLKVITANGATEISKFIKE